MHPSPASALGTPHRAFSRLRSRRLAEQHSICLVLVPVLLQLASSKPGQTHLVTLLLPSTRSARQQRIQHRTHDQLLECHNMSSKRPRWKLEGVAGNVCSERPRWRLIDALWPSVTPTTASKKCWCRRCAGPMRSPAATLSPACKSATWAGRPFIVGNMPRIL